MFIKLAISLLSTLASATFGVDICRTHVTRAIGATVNDFFHRLDKAYARFNQKPFTFEEYHSLVRIDEEKARHDLNRAAVRGLLKNDNYDSFSFNDNIILESGKVTKKILPVESPFIDETIVESYGLLELAREADTFEDTFSSETFRTFFSLAPKKADQILTLGLDFELLKMVDISPQGRPIYSFDRNFSQTIDTAETPSTPITAPPPRRPSDGNDAVDDPKPHDNATVQAAANTTSTKPENKEDRKLFERFDRAYARFSHQPFTAQNYENATNAYWQTASLDLKRGIVKGFIKADGRKYVFLEGVASSSGGVVREPLPTSPFSVGFVDDALADAFIHLERVQVLGTLQLETLQEVFSAQDFQSASSLPARMTRELLVLGTDIGIIKKETTNTGGDLYRFVKGATIPSFLKQKGMLDTTPLRSVPSEAPDPKPKETITPRTATAEEPSPPQRPSPTVRDSAPTPNAAFKRNEAELEAERNRPLFGRLDKALARFDRNQFTAPQYQDLNEFSRRAAILDLKRAVARGLVKKNNGDTYVFLESAISPTGGVVQDPLPISPSTVGAVTRAMANAFASLDDARTSGTLDGKFSVQDFQRIFPRSSHQWAREVLLLGTDAQILKREVAVQGYLYYFEDSNTPVPAFLKEYAKPSPATAVHPRDGAELEAERNRSLFGHLDKALARFDRNQFTAPQYQDLSGLSRRAAGLDIKRAVARGLVKNNGDTYVFLENAISHAGGVVQVPLPISPSTVGAVTRSMANAFASLDGARASGALDGKFSVQDFKKLFPRSHQWARDVLVLGVDAQILKRETAPQGALYYFEDSNTPVPAFLKEHDAQTRAGGRLSPAVHPRDGAELEAERNRPLFDRLDKALARFDRNPFTAPQYQDLSRLSSRRVATLDIKRAVARGLVKNNGDTYVFLENAISHAGGVVQVPLPISPSTVGAVTEAMANAFASLDGARASGALDGKFSVQDFKKLFTHSLQWAREVLLLGVDAQILKREVAVQGDLYYFEDSNTPVPAFLKEHNTQTQATKPSPERSNTRTRATRPSPERSNTRTRATRPSPATVVHPRDEARREAERNRPFFERLDGTHARFVHKPFTLSQYATFNRLSKQGATLDIKRAVARGLVKNNGDTYVFLENAISHTGGVERDPLPISPSTAGPVTRAMANAFTSLDDARASSTLDGQFSIQDFQNAASIPSTNTTRTVVTLGVDIGFLKREITGHGDLFSFVEDATMPTFLKQATAPRGGYPQQNRRPPPGPDAIITNADLEERRNKLFFDRINRAYVHFKETSFTQEEYRSFLEVHVLNAELDIGRAFVRGLIKIEGERFAFNKGIVGSTTKITNDVLPINSPTVGGDIIHAFSLLEEVRASAMFKEEFSLTEFYEHPSVLDSEAKKILTLGSEFGVVEYQYSPEGALIYRFNEDVEIPDSLKTLSAQ